MKYSFHLSEARLRNRAYIILCASYDEFSIVIQWSVVTIWPRCRHTTVNQNGKFDVSGMKNGVYAIALYSKYSKVVLKSMVISKSRGVTSTQHSRIGYHYILFLSIAFLKWGQDEKIFNQKKSQRLKMYLFLSHLEYK